MPSTHSHRAHGPTEVARLLTQLRRLEARCGRRAASVCLAVPPGVDEKELAEAFAERIEAEVLTTLDPTALVCRIVTVDFELHDDPTMDQGTK